eukprot:540243-Rhodomonas_salina.1
MSSTKSTDPATHTCEKDGGKGRLAILRDSATLKFATDFVRDQVPAESTDGRGEVPSPVPPFHAAPLFACGQQFVLRSLGACPKAWQFGDHFVCWQRTLVCSSAKLLPRFWVHAHPVAKGARVPVTLGSLATCFGATGVLPTRICSHRRALPTTMRGGRT